MVGKMSSQAPNDPRVEAQMFSPKLQKAFCEGASGTFDPSIINNRDPALEGAAIRGASSGSQGGAPQCAGGVTPVVITDPPPPVQGPFPKSDGGVFWVRIADRNIGFNTDTDPEPDIFVTPAQVVADGALSDQSKEAIHEKLIELTGSGLPNFTPPPLGG